MTLENEYVVLPTTSFKKDLENIIYYIKYKLKEPLIADNFYKLIIQKISSLKFMPNRYVRLQIIKNKNIRKLIIKNYVVIYEVNINTRASFYITYFSL